MKLRYSAGWNLPGCLPEMEPALFDTQAEAQAYIDAEWENAGTSAPWSDDEPYDDPYVYWVEEVVLDDCPFCDTGAATVPVWQAAPLDDTLACEDCAALSLPNV